LNQLAGHVVGRARPRRRIRQRTRFGLRELQQFAEIARRQIAARHQHEVGRADRRDRREVAQQLKRLVRNQRLVDGVCVRHQQQRVAVGRALRDGVGADDRAGSGPVVDHERLAPAFLQLGREEARIDIGRAARRERHD